MTSVPLVGGLPCGSYRWPTYYCCWCCCFGQVHAAQMIMAETLAVAPAVSKMILKSQGFLALNDPLDIWRWQPTSKGEAGR